MFSENLIQLRKLNNMSQEELVDLAQLKMALPK